MTVLSFLKFIINLFFYCIIGASILVFYLTVLLPYRLDEGFDVSGLGKLFTHAGPEHDSLGADVSAVLSAIQFVVFLTMVYSIKNGVGRFSSDNIHDARIACSLRFAGISAWIFAAIDFTLQVCIPAAMSRGYTWLSLNFSGFASSYFIVFFGAFLLYISIVLRKAAQIKEENDLTI